MVRVFEGAVAKRILEREYVKHCCVQEPVVVIKNDDGPGVSENFGFCKLHEHQKEDI